MSGLQALLFESQGLLWGFALVFARIGAVVFLLPALGEQMIPLRVRLAVALVLSAIVLPMVISGPTAPPSFGLLLSETSIGLAYGISLRLMAHSLMIAGAIAAQSTSLSQLFGSLDGQDPQPAIASFLYMAGLALFVVADLHLVLIGALVRSFVALPIGTTLLGIDVAKWGVALVGDVFALGFMLSAAFILSSTLYNVALGVVNKAMPQLMVSFVGAPAITMAGFILMMFVVPIALPIWLEAIRGVVVQPLGLNP